MKPQVPPHISTKHKYCLDKYQQRQLLGNDPKPDYYWFCDNCDCPYLDRELNCTNGHNPKQITILCSDKACVIVTSPYKDFSFEHKQCENHGFKSRDEMKKEYEKKYKYNLGKVPPLGSFISLGLNSPPMGTHLPPVGSNLLLPPMGTNQPPNMHQLGTNLPPMGTKLGTNLPPMGTNPNPFFNPFITPNPEPILDDNPVNNNTENKIEKIIKEENHLSITTDQSEWEKRVYDLSLDQMIDEFSYLSNRRDKKKT